MIKSVSSYKRIVLVVKLLHFDDSTLLSKKKENTRRSIYQYR